MNVRTIQFECWETSDQHGWHDEPRSFGDQIALIHSELSEALEEYRVNGTDRHVYYNSYKPEGIGIELADVIIRIMDLAYSIGIDVEEMLSIKMAFNKARPYRHGGKKL